MAVSNIHVPTLLVRGLLSDVVTQEGADDLLGSIPGATVVGVAGAAHMIAGDRNDAFSDGSGPSSATGSCRSSADPGE